jgi:hypothetical protein
MTTIVATMMQTTPSLRRDQAATTQALLSFSGDMLDKFDPSVAGACDDEVGLTVSAATTRRLPVVVRRCLRHGQVATALEPHVTTMQNV